MERNNSCITFSELRTTNRARALEYLDAKGRTILDWNETDIACALAGEVGELCNIIKKRFRDGATDDNFSAAKDEIADVQIYLDLLCSKMKVHLEDCLVNKFNKDSEKIGLKTLFYVPLPDQL